MSQGLFIVTPNAVTPNAVRGLKSFWKGEVGSSKKFRFLALLGMTERRLRMRMKRPGGVSG